MSPQNSSLATANAPSNETASHKLKPDDIQYLALEGGGGKGFAYLGAIDMLERITRSDGSSVMSKVEGFAGASAGAITALLLSIGYDFKALTTFLGETNFDAFFDPPTPRIRPQVGSSGVEVTSDSKAEKAFIEGDLQAWVEDIVSGNAEDLGHQILAAFLTSGVAVPAIGATVLLQAILLQGRKLSVMNGIPTAAKVILKDLNYYLAYWPNDLGLFSGKAARIMFDTLLQKAAAKRKGGLSSVYRNLTFRDHQQIFNKRLLVTGTNLRTGVTQLFSADETPNFPVADAIRISMGLPWIFKPYVITESLGSGSPPCGVYVDGGVWNNLPFREFDSNPPSDKKAASAAVASKKTGTKSTPRTLGLKLEIIPVPKIDTVFGLSAQMLQHGVFGSGESQVLDKYVDQCVILDIRGLDLLTFSPPKDPAENLRISNCSRRAVCRYFDQDINKVEPSIRDDADDKKTLEARQAAEACGPS